MSELKASHARTPEACSESAVVGRLPSPGLLRVGEGGKLATPDLSLADLHTGGGCAQVQGGEAESRECLRRSLPKVLARVGEDGCLWRRAAGSWRLPCAPGALAVAGAGGRAPASSLCCPSARSSQRRASQPGGAGLLCFSEGGQ